MKAEFTFHPVGQGLFYSGKINCDDKKEGNKEFNFVYDCGNIFSSQINNFVKSYIESNLSVSKHLDLFILSHYHWDHFNGLPVL
jgi:phosphoribosyl 1,2-cyclic phosphodiesterase